MSDSVSAVRRAAWPKPSVVTAEPADDAFNVLIVGVGGQGVIMVSKVLALLAQSQGFEVKQSEVHGMAKRGGSVFSHVRFGRRVWSPTIPKGEVDILVALEWAEGLRWLPFLKPGTGIFICDTKRIVPPFACLNRHPGAPLCATRKKRPPRSSPMSPKATPSTPPTWPSKLGNERAANVILLGALSTALEFPAADWERTVAEFVPKKTITRQSRSLPPRPRLDRGSAQHDAAGRSPGGEGAGADGLRLPRAPRNQSGVVQELRHLREDLPGALPAAQRRPHRRTGRAGQMHRLPPVRMAVPGFRHPRASRCRRAAPGGLAR